MGLGGHSSHYGLCAENGPVEKSVGMLPETRKSAVPSPALPAAHVWDNLRLNSSARSSVRQDMASTCIQWSAIQRSQNCLRSGGARHCDSVRKAFGVLSGQIVDRGRVEEDATADLA